MTWMLILSLGGMLVFFACHAPGLAAAFLGGPLEQPGVQDVETRHATLVAPRRERAEPANYNVLLFYDKILVTKASAATLPVVFYMPGWGGKAPRKEILLTRIAASGYLVVATDDVAHDPPEHDESAAHRAARVADFDYDRPDGVEAFYRQGDLKADLAARKISRLIDALRVAQKDEAASIIARADTARIAMVGFSFGGSVAEAALRDEPRVRAAVNLDGWNFGSSAATPTTKPYLVLASTNSMPPLEIGYRRKAVWAADRISEEREVKQLAQTNSRRVIVRGALHGDFSDGLHRAERWTDWRPWHLPMANPRKTRNLIDDLVLSFLDQNSRFATTLTQSCGPTPTCSPAGRE